MSKEQHTGGCLCGAVRYRFGKVTFGVVNCHCSQCRRTHGHHSAYTITKEQDLELLEERGLKWYHSSDHAQRGFCQECGASLFYNANGKDSIAISAGTIDEPTDLKTVKNIYTDDKGDYYELPEIDANLPS